MKRCPKCKLDKPTTAFHRNARKKDGLAWACKTCILADARNGYNERADIFRARRRAQHAKHRTTENEKHRAYYAKNKEAILNSIKRCRQRNTDRFKHAQRRHKYGITPEQFQDLLFRQGNTCAICKRPETKIVRGVLSDLSVDHSHATGTVRELLCSNCNMAVGYTKDNPDTAMALFAYVSKWAGK